MIPSFGAPLPNGRSAYIAPLGLWEKATADEIAAWERQDPWLTLGYHEGWLARYLAHSDPGSTRYLLRLDGRPAGLVGVRSPWLLGPFLELLLVAPEAQGAGLGRFSLNALVRAAIPRQTKCRNFCQTKCQRPPSGYLVITCLLNSLAQFLS